MAIKALGLAGVDFGAALGAVLVGPDDGFDEGLVVCLVVEEGDSDGVTLGPLARGGVVRWAAGGGAAALVGATEGAGAGVASWATLPQPVAVSTAPRARLSTATSGRRWTAIGLLLLPCSACYIIPVGVRCGESPIRCHIRLRSFTVDGKIAEVTRSNDLYERVLSARNTWFHA